MRERLPNRAEKRREMFTTEVFEPEPKKTILRVADLKRGMIVRSLETKQIYLVGEREIQGLTHPNMIFAFPDSLTDPRWGFEKVSPNTLIRITVGEQ